MKDIIQDAMARAFFVSAWAESEEELGHSHSGEELMDIAPETAPEAEDAAEELVKAMEEENGMSVEDMFLQAAEAQGLSEEEAEEDDEMMEDFGHTTAMQAMGHGVSWSDDYKPHGLKVPRHEFSHLDIDWPEEESDDKTLRERWQDNEVEVTVWDERDRLHICVQEKDSGECLIEWWDEDAQQMFEDGFFKSGRGFEESVIKHAEEMKVPAYAGEEAS
jgi:hypothetical protein